MKISFSTPWLCGCLFIVGCGFASCSVAADSAASAKAPAKEVLIDDHFDRTESNPAEEQVGGRWRTNSKARAKGNKQVALVDGAMKVTRHPIADHGVSVVHPAEFKDASIQCRFKLNRNDELGINLADLKEKSVHAGHLCMARINLRRVVLLDLKTGQMKKEIREARLAKTLTEDQKKQVAAKSAKFKVQLKPDSWHHLAFTIKDETMTVHIDGTEVGTFTSPGIGHPTKRMLRLAVKRNAWIDDVRVTRHVPTQKAGLP